MIVDVYNQKNEKIGETDLPDRIFKIRWNPDLVHQALATQLANSRQPLAHAKGRGEIRGGGRKPWRQKGTGRARHGSIRSPLWVGGGVTHGPIKEKIFNKKINKKMKRLAIGSVLSKKISENELKVIDQFETQIKKAKEWKKVLENLVDKRSKTLLIPTTNHKDIHQAVANIRELDAISPFSLNIYDLLKHKNIILEKGAVEEIEKHYK